MSDTSSENTQMPPPPPPLRMYVVVRQDLAAGAQIAQAIHAFREFVEFHPSEEQNWYKLSNTIVVLGCRDENELMTLRKGAVDQHIKFSMFREPDMNNQVTAIAFEPGQKTSDYLRHLNLAGSKHRSRTPRHKKHHAPSWGVFRG